MPKAYRVPEDLRATLAKPFGMLYSGEQVTQKGFADMISQAPMVVTVGDRVTETLGRMGRAPDVQVVDSKENRVERAPPEVPYARKIEVQNPPGTITEEAIDGIREAFGGQKPVRVLVDGEEDLLAVPVIVIAPFSALVLYGQPGAGVVAVPVDSASKSRSREILAKMGMPEVS